MDKYRGAEAALPVTFQRGNTQSSPSSFQSTAAVYFPLRDAVHYVVSTTVTQKKKAENMEITDKGRKKEIRKGTNNS